MKKEGFFLLIFIILLNMSCKENEKKNQPQPPVAEKIKKRQGLLKGIESSIEFMKSPAFEPAKSAVIVSDVSPSQNLNGESSVRIVDYQPERISIQIDGNSSGLLVITDAYYPGWEATIDGNATDIFQTNVLFRGIMVPAGEHEVELFFNPTSVIIGRAVSAAGLIIWILIAGILFYVARFRR